MIYELKHNNLFFDYTTQSSNKVLSLRDASNSKILLNHTYRCCFHLDCRFYGNFNNIFRTEFGNL